MKGYGTIGLIDSLLDDMMILIMGLETPDTMFGKGVMQLTLYDFGSKLEKILKMTILI